MSANNTPFSRKWLDESLPVDMPGREEFIEAAMAKHGYQTSKAAKQAESKADPTLAAELETLRGQVATLTTENATLASQAETLTSSHAAILEDLNGFKSKYLSPEELAADIKQQKEEAIKLALADAQAEKDKALKMQSEAQVSKILAPLNLSEEVFGAVMPTLVGADVEASVAAATTWKTAIEAQTRAAIEAHEEKVLANTPGMPTGNFTSQQNGVTNPVEMAETMRTEGRSEGEIAAMMRQSQQG